MLSNFEVYVSISHKTFTFYNNYALCDGEELLLWSFFLDEPECHNWNVFFCVFSKSKSRLDLIVTMGLNRGAELGKFLWLGTSLKTLGIDNQY